MSRSRQVSCVLAASALAAFLSFGYFSHAADVAMDKTGVGDLALFDHYSHLAGAWFWSAAGLWLGSIISTQRAPEPFRGKALFWFGLVQPVLSLAAFGILVVA